MSFIYSLESPFEPGIVRYIGKSNNPVQRLKTHIWAAKQMKHICLKNSWIKSLLNAGVKPEMKILDEGNEDEIYEKEKHYIKLFKSFGARLVNMCEGGRGVDRKFKKTLQQLGKTNKSNKGRKFSAEHCANLALSNSRRWKNGFKLNVSARKNIKAGIKKKAVECFDLQGNKIHSFLSVRDASRALNVNAGSITYCAKEKINKVDNKYIFKYAN